MRQRLHATLAGCCGLISLTAALFWCRSTDSRVESVVFARILDGYHADFLAIADWGGSLCVTRTNYYHPGGDYHRSRAKSLLTAEREIVASNLHFFLARRAGRRMEQFAWESFSWPASPSGSRQEIWLAAVPFWLIAAAAAVPPAVWLRRWRSRARVRARLAVGCCAACGYDLRATPRDDGPLFDRCPECGKSGQVATEPR
jgi:hypothetical protein